nr:hypothetical protein CFP56_32258 [Quercus suber]
MGSFTQAIKNLFKRGKKEKPGAEEPSKESVEQGSPSDLPSKDDLPPTLPAIKSSSIFTTDKPLPPTHESSLVQQKPANADVVPRGTENEASVIDGKSQVRTPDNPEDVAANGQGFLTPEGISPVKNDDGHSMAVSAIEEDDKDESSPRVDGAADASAAGVPEAAAAAALPSEPTKATTNATHTLSTAHENIDPAATNTKEVGPSAESTDAKAPSHIDASSVSARPVQFTTDEGKIAVLHEPPPPIANMKAAPGMSATSGPLEDFPEGV